MEGKFAWLEEGLTTSWTGAGTEVSEKLPEPGPGIVARLRQELQETGERPWGG